ncbi:hypothetical protein KEM48_008363 [Puccinia striiformis f. sp. tritici PST-130]|nr:hypothetical protein KEM48_008363 [Puccinia striiformis f. sp. tritici PST-130]
MTTQQSSKLSYRAYDAQTGDDLTQIINLMESELSEPYIIVEHLRPHLCFLCFSEPTEPTEGGEREAIGAIKERNSSEIGPMAMQRMIADGAQELFWKPSSIIRPL